VARQRTEITMDPEGNPQRRAAISVDGPAPKSRRARAARARVERRATRRHTRNESRRFGGRPITTDADDDLRDDPEPDVAVDVEA
jgi:hypothetical protein